MSVEEDYCAYAYGLSNALRTQMAIITVAVRKVLEVLEHNQLLAIFGGDMNRGEMSLRSASDLELA